MKLSEHYMLRILLIICFIFITLSLVLIKNSPATGYELSIYASTPHIVWIFLIGSISIGIFIIVYQAFTERENNYWSIAFFILLLNESIFLSLPALKGYFLYGGSDPLLHLGYAKDIISTGYTGDSDFYPIIHILVFQISGISDIPPEALMRYLPALFNILFMMVFIYILAKITLSKKSKIMLSSAASITLYFNSLHATVYPHVFSIFLFPCIFYLYFKAIDNNLLSFRLLFIIFLILLPFTHPASSLILIFLFIAMELARHTYNKKFSIKTRSISLNPSMISFITFFTWFSSFTMFGNTVRSLIDSIHEPFKNPQILTTTEVLGPLGWYDLIELFMKMYGDSIIYIILSLISALIIGRKIFRNKVKQHHETRRLYVLLTFFFISIPVALLFFTGTRQQTVGRLLNLNYMMVVTPILVGITLNELLKKSRIYTSIVCIILILASTIGLFGVYASPWINQPNWQITNMDMQGTKWFLSHKNTALGISGMGYEAAVPAAILGYSKTESKEYRPVVYDPAEEGGIPDHFNYTYHKKLGESFKHDRYIIITKRFLLANANPILAKKGLYIPMYFRKEFNKKDFIKLEKDSSVSRLYSNGEFDVLYLKSYPI